MKNMTGIFKGLHVAIAKYHLIFWVANQDRDSKY